MDQSQSSILSNTLVVNIHKSIYDVYIGRAGKGQDGYFGNPADTGTREEKVAKYRVYFYERIQTDPEFKKRIEELKGKKLGCFCFPLLCHGMVIIEYLDGTSIQQQLLNAQKSSGKRIKPNLFDEV